MTPQQAAKILEIDEQTPPEKLEACFQELRAKLEGKIAKAPTPGLKEKYRATLDEITQAFEVLTLAADSSLLPLAQRTEAGRGDGSPDRGPATPGAHDNAPTPRVVEALPSRKARKSGREFLVVVFVALVLLGGGGWWVMKSQAESAEAARVAAESARIAEEARIKREQEEAAATARREQALTQLRSRLAELNVAHDALTRLESTAERELSELRAAERDAVREAKGNLGPVALQLGARVRAMDRYVSWLRETLPSHPSRVAQAKAEEFLGAKALEESTETVEAFAAGIQQLKAEIAEARADTSVVGELQVESNLPEASWKITDSFGLEFSGTGAAIVSEVGLGRATIVFQAPRWPDVKQTVEVVRGKTAAVHGEFAPAILTVQAPDGARASIAGTSPEADGTWQLEPGVHLLVVNQSGFAPAFIRIHATPGARLERPVKLNQDYLSGSLELWKYRLDEIRDNEAFVKSASSLAGYLRMRGDIEGMKELVGLVLRRSYTRLSDEAWPSSFLIAPAALGLREETRALIGVVEGLMARNRFEFEHASTGLRMMLQMKVCAFALIGESSGVESTLGEMVRMNLTEYPNKKAGDARQEAAFSIASSFNTYGFHPEARQWVARAQREGGSAPAFRAEEILADVEIYEAAKQGDVGKYLSGLRKMTHTQLASLAFYQPGQPAQVHVADYFFPIYKAYYAGADKLIDAAAEYLRDQERVGAIRGMNESWGKSIGEIIDPQQRAAKRLKVVQDRDQIIKEAQAPGDPSPGLARLAGLVEGLIQPTSL